MPAADYAGWVRYLCRWPTMDMVGPRLLGVLCSLTANAHFHLDKPARAEGFAPWLETPGERERRVAEKARTRRAIQAQLVGDAYMRTRGHNA